jgi:copper homeostasis protein
VILVEAAVDSVAAALAAEAAGATQLELCADLDIGGITPSLELQREVGSRCRLPVHTMIRPRGGSFVYSPAEVESMLACIAEAASQGAAGIVTGALRGDGAIDAAITGRLRDAAHPLPMTFHRAFDATPHPGVALEALIALGADRILTSGGSPDARTGAPMIARLVGAARGRIRIIAGGGVNAANVGTILRETGTSEIHARCEPDGERIRGIVQALHS